MILERIQLKPFEPAFEFYCFKNCYLQWLDMYGIRDAFYYLDCTQNWQFTDCEEDRYGYKFSTSEIYSSVLPSHRGKVNMFDQTDLKPEQIWERNNQLLKEGVPFIAAVDVFYLPYTPFYGKKHSYHALLVTGENENNQYDVIDWYPPWYFKGQISKEHLDLARGSDNPSDGLLSGNPISYLWTELDEQGWNESGKNLIAEALELSINRFYGTDSSSERNINGLYMGTKALSALRGTVARYMQSEPEVISQFLQDLHGKLYFVPTRKKLFHNYLEHAYLDYGFLKLPKIIESVYENITEWKKFLNLSMRASIAPTEENCVIVLDMLDNLHFKEKDINYLLFDSTETIRV